jgi:hypothetical protein
LFLEQTFLIVSMLQKGNIPKSNQRGEYKTWHFTSVLTPTHEIHADINWLATNKKIVVDAQYLLVKACIKAKVMNEARPGWVTFISWRFSHVDAKLWISNARAKLPLQDLPFEGYIQSNHTIDLPRLHNWMPDAVWEPVGCRWHQNTDRSCRLSSQAVGNEYMLRFSLMSRLSWRKVATLAAFRCIILVIGMLTSLGNSCPC